MVEMAHNILGLAGELGRPLQHINNEALDMGSEFVDRGVTQ